LLGRIGCDELVFNESAVLSPYGSMIEEERYFNAARVEAPVS
jgi:hypothetical protein